MNLDVRGTPDRYRLRGQSVRLWLRRHATALTWSALALGAIATLVLGTIGFRNNMLARKGGPDYTISTLFYLALQLFVMNSGGVEGPVGWELEVARVFGAVVAVGAVVRVIAAVFHDTWRDLRVRFYRGHVVLCGLGRKGRVLAEDFLQGVGRRVVVVERDPDNPYLKLVSEWGAEVIVTDAANEYVLRKAGTHRARELIIATGDDNMNIRIATTAWALVDRYPAAELDCRVHLVDARLCDLLTHHGLLPATKRFEVRPFGLFANSARLLFEQRPLWRDGMGAADHRTIHLLIIGFGHMGEGVLLEAARTGHFPNLRRLRVTVVDRYARHKEDYVLSRYPHLREICDVDFREHDADDCRFREEMVKWACDDGQLLHIAVCFDDDHAAVSCALHLPEPVKRCAAPIYVRISEDYGLAGLLIRHSAPSLGSFCAFGLPGEACKVDRVFRPDIDALAQCIHADYLAEQQAKGVLFGSSEAMRPWDSISEHHKDQNRQQAEDTMRKPAAIGYRVVRKEDLRGNPISSFTDKEIEVLAQMEHLRWCASKWLAGWKCGPKKDDQAMTHPCLVPWEDLSEAERDKDREPVRRVHEYLDKLGYVVAESASASSDGPSCHGEHSGTTGAIGFQVG